MAPYGRCARSRRYLRLELQAHRLSVRNEHFRVRPLKDAAGALPIMADYVEFKAWWQKR